MQARQLPDLPDVIAPDGSEVRILCGLRGGSMAHFSLSPGKVSKAIMHRTVEEIWYFVAGEGEMWRSDGRQELVIALRPGLSLTIPVGTSFQFRSTGSRALEAVAITMPPWPGEDEAVLVKGVW
jgi:mannose-6-phosphate isomerase-like protein (cupin superfamily)